MSPKCLHDLLSFKIPIILLGMDNLVDVPRVSTSRYGKATFVMRPLSSGTISQIISELLTSSVNL